MPGKFDARHPLYVKFSDKWSRMRAVFDGEDTIKQGKDSYLPIPSGMTAKDGGIKYTPMYEAYILRAQFPEILEPTVRGMNGVLHGQDAVFELPASVTHMELYATLDALTLAGLHRRVTEEILTVGRYALLADVNDLGESYIAPYVAEAVVNWDTMVVEGELVFSFVVLNESGPKRDPETWEWIETEQFRVLELDEDGNYQATLWIKSEKGDWMIQEGYPKKLQKRGGGFIDYIPLVVINSTDVHPDPDQVPLYGVAKSAIAAYRKSADYEHGLFWGGQETLFIIGQRREDLPDRVGAGVVHGLPKGARAEYVGPEGTMIDALRTAIKDDLDTAVFHGTKMFDSDQRQVESGEALRLRHGAETATLKTIAKTSAAGIKLALEYCTDIMGALVDVPAKPHLKFVEQPLGPEEVKALVLGWQSGAFSKQTLFENLQRGGIVDPDLLFEEEEERIKQELELLPSAGDDPGAADIGEEDEINAGQEGVADDTGGS